MSQAVFKRVLGIRHPLVPDRSINRDCPIVQAAITIFTIVTIGVNLVQESIEPWRKIQVTSSASCKS